jgi:hypothetical protein
MSRYNPGMSESFPERSPSLRLEYGKRRSPARRYIRRGVIALALLGTCAAGIYFQKPVLAQARLLYWQRRCMNYEEPPGHAAYVHLDPRAPESEKRAFTVFRQDPEYVIDRLQVAEFHPPCLDRFDRLTSKPGPFGRPPCLYLHHARSKSGNDRLVRVDLLFAGRQSQAEFYGIHGIVYRPATLSSESNGVFGEWGLNMYYFADPSAGDFFRFFTGQPDLAHGSHFTIDYDDRITRSDSGPLTVHGVIDGELLDDDTITLSPRSGTLAGGNWRLNNPMAAPTDSSAGK